MPPSKTSHDLSEDCFIRWFLSLCRPSQLRSPKNPRSCTCRNVVAKGVEWNDNEFQPVSASAVHVSFQERFFLDVAELVGFEKLQIRLLEGFLVWVFKPCFQFLSPPSSKKKNTKVRMVIACNCTKTCALLDSTCVVLVNLRADFVGTKHVMCPKYKTRFFHEDIALLERFHRTQNISRFPSSATNCPVLVPC